MIVGHLFITLSGSAFWLRLGFEQDSTFFSWLGLMTVALGVPLLILSLMNNSK
jgi:hypothetical protein